MLPGENTKCSSRGWLFVACCLMGGNNPVPIQMDASLLSGGGSFGLGLLVYTKVTVHCRCLVIVTQNSNISLRSQ